MAHPVKCFYCGKTFNRDKVECVPIEGKANRYAHVECAANHETILSEEEKDLLALETYIEKLFNTDYVNPRIRKQIKDYHENYKYTYRNIHRALMYFYEVKGNSTEKANNGIGIVPFVHDDAYRYYYSIWVAQQTNEAKPIEQYQSVEQIITIPLPQRKEKRKRSAFAFLD